MSRFDPVFAAFLSELDLRHRRRQLVPLQQDAATGPGATRILRQGQPLVNFSSNDYLGLASHPALIERAQDWAARWGMGATASRLVCGTWDIHLEVEAKLAAFKQTEAALLFASGFQANATVLPALLDRRLHGDTPLVFADALIHASLHHGCRAAGLKPIFYRHNDLADLAGRLSETIGREGPKFILTESVFSMDGDRADVPALADLAAAHNAFLYLDEAHATGVLGERGAGLAGLARGRVDLVMGTFSKAFGSFGAYVAGSRSLRDYLINRCGGFIYSTGLPPSLLGAIDAALDLVPDMTTERNHLAAMGERLRMLLRGSGFDTGPSTTQIVPVLIGDEAETLELSRWLEENGFLGVAIRPPTVPQGSSRIRLSLSAAHRMEEVEALAHAFAMLAPRRVPAGAA